ncbi:DNA polymerase III subunit chi [Halomonas sp. PAMB 3232]|uniref:DNA polymerase III subunit chi n=1 Tax=Halomonas sp. PAMB 3232 TaxID=3075221 RepID=UPI0028972696|nr:DNA polymerase III subunit chi [Halomonas sp. PAMB 3232]WNL39535.1 DNA polymerase III subunit chi [Halomonas sp. PAMB 3232]
MARIDFYILQDTTLEGRLAFACKLAETIHRKGYRLHLHCEGQTLAEQADEALWTFRDDAYLPHAIEGSDLADSVPITLGFNELPSPREETALLNLHPDIPAGIERFTRVAEIINQHQQVLIAKRACWQRYKELGHEVVPHKIG